MSVETKSKLLEYRSILDQVGDRIRDLALNSAREHLAALDDRDLYGALVGHVITGEDNDKSLRSFLIGKPEKIAAVSIHIDAACSALTDLAEDFSGLFGSSERDQDHGC